MTAILFNLFLTINKNNHYMVELDEVFIHFKDFKLLNEIFAKKINYQSPKRAS